ncbi:MAG: NAD-dependent protein deacylase [Bacteroidaceae bacterium]|nr:NAD-dependent protein deacylase [Bacteroidaceae bacterium]
MKKMVILTGAGMSAESGISTFRDSGGLWEQHRVEDVATIEGYIRNPQLVIDFYNERRKQLPTVKPCRGHELVAALEKNYDVTVVTQNVDDLHERAGSTNVIHLHGELMKVTSSISPNDPLQIQTLTPEHLEIHMGETAPDGSQLRPFIVWFGEAVPMIEKAAEEAMKADIFVVIGTSLNVYPAAGLVQFVAPEVPVFLIDPKDVPWTSSHRYTHIKKGASAGMEELLEDLGIEN